MPDRTDARAWLRHRAAALYGITPDGVGSLCACCGASPYPAGERPRSGCLSDSFSDHDLLLDGCAPAVCRGCDTLLGGRPGREPPPFRTLHIFVLGDGVRILDRGASVSAVLLAPPGGPLGLVGATSRKRHAWLRAERCDARRIVVGTDAGAVEYLPLQHRPLLDAVAELLASFGRDAIRRGDYSAPAIAAAGASWWRDRESVVARHRPSALLDLLCYTLPRPEARPTPGGPVALEDDDLDALHLLTRIAIASGVRRRDGLAFWRGLFRHRVHRFGRLPLRDMLSRLAGELGCQPHNMAEVGWALEGWDAGRQAQAARAIRDRGPLLVALSFDAVQRARPPQVAVGTLTPQEC